jgi:hypothetical protein
MIILYQSYLETREIRPAISKFHSQRSKVGPIRDVEENWRKDVLVSSTFALARNDQTEFIYIIKKKGKTFL